MAVDSAAKRASATLFLVPCLCPGVFPDGTIGQGDRQASSWSYSGILAAAVSFVTIKATQSEIDALANIPEDWPRASEHRRKIAVQLNKLIDIFQASSSR